MGMSPGWRPSLSASESASTPVPDADSLCALRITSREAVPLAPSVVEGSAELLGLPAQDRSRLGTLVVEVIEALVREAFELRDDVELEVEVLRVPGDLRVVIRDQGAPLDFGAGYPPRVAELVRLGFADDLSFVHEGRNGNRTEISKHLKYARVGEDAQFVAEVEADPTPEPTIGEDGQVVVDLRAMTPDDVLEVARLFYRTYGYTVAYAPVVYEPELLAELVASGKHVGTIAVAPDGRVVGHIASDVHDSTATTGKIGLLAVDQNFRRHNITARLVFTHFARLLEQGFVGQYTEAVTVHVGSQKATLRGGGYESGLMLAAQSNDLDFKGFDTDEKSRKAVMLFYCSFGNTPERDVYVPPTYADVIRRIYAEGKLPRTVHSEYLRRPEVPMAPARIKLKLNHETGVGWIYVDSYGEGFLEALQTQVHQLQTNRFDQILVVLPLSDPLTQHFGSGLLEIGLSFGGVYPEYGDGDVLVLQNLNNVELRPDEILVASPLGEYIRDFVLDDQQRAADRAARRDRNRASMSRIFEVLD